MFIFYYPSEDLPRPLANGQSPFGGPSRKLTVLQSCHACRADTGCVPDRIPVHRSFGENQSGRLSCMLRARSCGGRPPTFFNLTSPGWVESPRCGAVVWRAVVERKADDRAFRTNQSMSLALKVAVKAQTVCEQSPPGCPARRTMPKQARTSS